MNTDFLLIGGGCGGFETALHLRKLAPDATITLVNPRPYLVYRPWLMSSRHSHVAWRTCRFPCTKPPPRTGCSWSSIPSVRWTTRTGA
jgi:NADH dehydrogenase FAD-containing subunit